MAHDHKAFDPKAFILTEKQLADVALAAAKEAVRENTTEIFSLLGIDVANVESLNRYRKNIEAAEQFRLAKEKVGARVGLTIVTLGTTGVAIAVWEYFRLILGK